MKAAFLFVIGMILLMALFSCASERMLHDRPALEGQELWIRDGHEGKLTNRRCIEADKMKCVKFDMVEYDLNDSSIRTALNRLNFECEIGGNLYKIALNRPGFVQHKGEKACWLCKPKKIEVDYLDSIKDFVFLVGAATRCYQK